METDNLGKLILARLASVGSDLAKSHPIDFYLYLGMEEAAYQLAIQLKSAGFDVDVVPGAKAETWLCLARKLIVPDEKELATLGDWFAELVVPYDAEFDGWESEIIF